MFNLFEWPPEPARPVNIRNEEYDVRIDRKTKWGNPFIIGKDGTREDVIKKYKEWVCEQPHLMESLHELKGKRLGCWCHPQPCHGDILAEMVNNLGSDTK